MAGQLLLVNPGPKKGRKKGARRASTSKKRAPARRRSTTFARLRRRTRRNPIAGRGIAGAVIGQVKGAALGAVGGALLDVALRPLPLAAKTGNVGHLTRAGIAIVAGVVGKRIPMVGQAALGALTITLYNVVRQYVSVPMGLGEISDADLAEIAGTDVQNASMLGTYAPAALAAPAGMGMSGYEPAALSGYGDDY